MDVSLLGFVGWFGFFFFFSFFFFFFFSFEGGASPFSFFLFLYLFTSQSANKLKRKARHRSVGYVRIMPEVLVLLLATCVSVCVCVQNNAPVSALQAVSDVRFSFDQSSRRASVHSCFTPSLSQTGTTDQLYIFSNNNNVFFHVLFLQIGAQSPLQSNEPKLSTQTSTSAINLMHECLIGGRTRAEVVSMSPSSTQRSRFVLSLLKKKKIGSCYRQL